MVTSDRRRTFRGARVGLKDETSQLTTATHPQVELYSATGCRLAMENRHKNWAKRWLRVHGKWV